jgi:pSer/pThr/pTyr-binding forkhead associated (FHA) protein
MTMQGEPERPGSGAKRAGPQGTQVFSRDQIASILEESADVDSRDKCATLVLLSASDGDDTRVFPLKSDRLTIGRSTVCDVCIDEASMSSEHARLVQSEGAWRIINLLSTNGVFVNDEKVFSHRLADGDEIRLGRTRLRFHDPDAGTGDGSSHSRWPLLAGGAAVVVALAALAFWLLR